MPTRSRVTTARYVAFVSIVASVDSDAHSYLGSATFTFTDYRSHPLFPEEQEVNHVIRSDQEQLVTRRECP